MIEFSNSELFSTANKRWEDINKENLFSKIVNPTLEVIDFIEECKKYKKKSLLDIGTGSGRHLFYSAKNGFESCYACDISNSAIQTIHSKLLPTSKIEKNNVVVGDILSLPFDDLQFDAIICRAVITHFTIEKIEKAISQIYNKLAPFGLVLITFISKNSSQYKIGTEIERNTFVMPKSDIERGIPHHFVDETEVRYFTSSFKKLKLYHHTNPEEQIDIKDGNYNFNYKFMSSHYIFMGVKPNC